MIYFIDIEDEAGVIKDLDGFNFNTREDAFREALSCLAPIMADRGMALDGRQVTAYVRDADGQTVYKATLTLTGSDLV